MKILGIIPARGGSKGVPRKNIKLLGNKPLIQYTIESAKKSKLLNRVILSSEDEEIIETAKGLGLDVPFVRPTKFSTDNARSIDVVKHAIQFLENERDYYDAVCLLQVSSPFRSKGFIDKAIKQFIEKGSDSLISVLPVPDIYNPHWVFELNDKNELQLATREKNIIGRRQDLPRAFHREGSIYITKTNCIKKGTFYGNSITYVESNPNLYVNIDTISDWEVAKERLKYYLKEINL